MKIDVTKLPLGEALVGFVLVAVVLTFVLAFASVSGGDIESEEAVAELSPTPAATSTGDGTPGEGTVVEVAMIPIIQFDRTDLTVPAGQAVTLTADNQDTGIPHNWAVYASEEAAISGEAALAATAICADCTETITFDPPDPGVYFFRCDVHPIQMVGTITVG